MRELLIHLKAEQVFLQTLYQRASRQLSEIPPTDKKLSLSREKTHVKYYLYDGYDPSGRPINKKYLPVSQLDQARSIASSDYYKREITEIRRQLRLIKQLIHAYENDKIQSILTSMHPDRQALISPLVPTDETFLKNWLSDEYPLKPFPEGMADFRTERGERVRSKSEIMIADKYYISGIPYKYERPLTLKNGTVIHPDFTVLNKRLRKEYYHEHFGMVDDPKYAVQMVNRITEYRRNNIYIGEQLIVTFETSMRPLQKADLEDLISHYLI